MTAEMLPLRRVVDRQDRSCPVVDCSALLVEKTLWFIVLYSQHCTDWLL